MTLKGPSVVLVAAPLMARSGVYRSTIDLVNAARGEGRDWSALIGLRPDAAGKSVSNEHVDEFIIETHGRAVLGDLRNRFDSDTRVQNSEVVVTLISQSDIAFERSIHRERVTWVAWTRGAPWPPRGEAKVHHRVVSRILETRALRKADSVWATTPILADTVAKARRPEIVTAGVPGISRGWSVKDADGSIVWAGRFDQDKNPMLATHLSNELARETMLFGAGPLETRIRESAGPHARVMGWAKPEDLWKGAALFLGTSFREAFGRSAVEAAMYGVPMIISDQYGAAPMLFTDPDLRRLCVLPTAEPQRWVASARRLLNDLPLLTEVSNHVNGNSQRLTIESSFRAALAQIEQARS